LSISRSKINLLLLLLLAALPVALAHIPGMADLPNHLARHAVLASYGDGGPLDRWFRVDWRWIGNLGVDLPVLLLAPWLGVEGATRLIVALIAPLTVLGIVTLSRAAHGRLTGGAALALPLAMAYPWAFGFINYCLSIALALLVTAWWIRQPPARWWQALLFGLAALAVFTAHIMGWAVLLILIGAGELSKCRTRGDLLRASARGLPLLLPLIALLAWRGGDGGGPLFVYASDALIMRKLMHFVTILRGVNQPLDLAMTGLIGLGAVIALGWAGRRRFDPRLGLAGGLLIVATLLLPTTLLGSWGADLRLAPVAVLVCLLALAPAKSARIERLLIMLGVALFVLRAGLFTVVWHQQSQALDQRLGLLDAVPKGARLGFIATANDCAEAWRLSPERKLGSYAVVRRAAFSNTMFQIPGSDVMIIRDPADRVRWFDGSQDIAAVCPAGGIDQAALAARLTAMQAARFEAIWLATAVPITPPLGYRLMRRTTSDQLLIKN
jgi:hypothetical protein